MVQTRALLLVEDDPEGASLLRALLDEDGDRACEIIHVSLLREAQAALSERRFDVVLLDLDLPDCKGVETVTTLRQTAATIPIVVLTGNDEEEVANACINAGAQDFISKSEARARALQRSIGYAITRQREAQLRELEEAVRHYRALSSRAQGTTVTAALLGSGAISMRNPESYEFILGSYSSLFRCFVSGASDRLDAPRAAKEQIVAEIGDANGGPRDLIDVHVAALEHATSLTDQSRSRTLVFEARLLALEMMGLLVDYYRVGHRRRLLKGS